MRTDDLPPGKGSYQTSFHFLKPPSSIYTSFIKIKKMNHFIALNQLAAEEALTGALLSTIQTENLTVAYTHMKAGVQIPLHQHPEEAIDIILDGILEMEIGEKTDMLTPGMLTTVPSQVPHAAKAITDCRVVTIFYPQRNK